jgi:hypothetical protein
MGKEGFVGSGLTFCGKMAESDHRMFSCQYSHTIGHAVVHLGHQRHGADNIISGERHNLIIWCKNEVYRSSSEFEAKMHSYEKESGPPDTRCVSFTHDRDYVLYKDYPPGKNPYSFDSGAESEEDGKQDDEPPGGILPWCPPLKFGYDGIPSQNKLMLEIYHQLSEEEDKRKRKK